MQRLESNGLWSLFDPKKARALTDLYGDQFKAVYEECENQGLAAASMTARGLWDIIADSIRETGGPSIMFSDNINGVPFILFAAYTS